MKNLRSILYCILAVSFTAVAINSCKNGEDGMDGKDGKDGQQGSQGSQGTQGTPGSVVSIGDNCNWYIDGIDTGKPACATSGDPGSNVTIGTNGNWFIDGIDTGVSASGLGAQIVIGDNGNWIINGVDTGVQAQGPKGDPGSSVAIGANGNWFIDGVDTGVSASGSVISIGENGNWFIDGEDTGVAAGTVTNTPMDMGSWLFEDPENLLKATIGKPLKISFTPLVDLPEVGEVIPIAGPNESKKAARVPAGTHFEAEHGMSPTDGLTYITDYTIFMWVKVNTNGRWGAPLTRTGNGTDAETQITNTGTIGVGQTGYTPVESVMPDVWHRLYFTFKTGDIRYYKGTEKLTLPNPTGNNDVRFRMKPDGIQFFTHNRSSSQSPLHYYVDVAEITMWNRALTEEEIEELENEFESQ